MTDARKNTNRLIELMDDDIIGAYAVAVACLKYMSEDEVTDMMRLNEFNLEDESEDDNG